jgi:hypothetical protein
MKYNGVSVATNGPLPYDLLLSCTVNVLACGLTAQMFLFRIPVSTMPNTVEG